jgi:hypothetical protein
MRLPESERSFSDGQRRLSFGVEVMLLDVIGDGGGNQASDRFVRSDTTTNIRRGDGELRCRNQMNASINARQFARHLFQIRVNARSTGNRQISEIQDTVRVVPGWKIA